MKSNYKWFFNFDKITYPYFKFSDSLAETNEASFAKLICFQHYDVTAL